MKVDKTLSVVVKDEYGVNILVGSKIIYQGTDGEDRVGIFRGFEKGKIVIENYSDDKTRRVLPKSIKKVFQIEEITVMQLPFADKEGDEVEEDS